MNAWLLGLVLLSASLSAPTPAAHQDAPPRPYRAAAGEALSWLRAHAIETPRGSAWAADPDHPESLSADLYQGVSGVVFALLDAARSTGDPDLDRAARAGADWLLGWLESEENAQAPCGLYTGLAGVGYVLETAWRQTGESRYGEGARIALDRLLGNAKPLAAPDASDLTTAGRGIDWGTGTDIIAGSAGIGLYLLDAARVLEREDALAAACRAGDGLLAVGQPEGAGIDWPMAAGVARRYPNFAHGTAGIAFFLARLGRVTGEARYLEGARRGLDYLRGVARGAPDGCLIFHDRPGGEGLFYLGWCHGPAGTARAFFEVAGAAIGGGEQERESDEMLAWVRRGAHSIMTSGIPEKAQPGFWNNVSRCCGSAGVIDFLLGLYLHGGDRADLDFACRMADDLIARSRVTPTGRCWPQAEHRIHPEWVVAQTGLMQGAAGIAMTLLHLDRVLGWKEPSAERADWLRLPDDPF